MAAVRFEPHLVDLLARAAVADHRANRADPAARAAAAGAARRERASASVRLDGSPLTDAIVEAVDSGAGPQRPAGPTDVVATARGSGRPDVGGWARALQLEGMPTEDVAAVEYANVLSADRLVDELAPLILSEPRDALTAVHAEVCRGLVAPEVVGRLRRTSQAVHDGAQGLMVYSAPEPATVPAAFNELLRWLREGSAALPALLAAAVAELRFLQLCPFEAGNGRTARLVGRAVGVARGFDRHGLAVPERIALADALGYYREVAASTRRRDDVTRWAERHAEAVVRSLEMAADALDPLPPESGPRPEAAVPDVRDGESLTELARRTGVSLAQARARVDELREAGAVETVPGSHGLRLSLR